MTRQRKVVDGMTSSGEAGNSVFFSWVTFSKFPFIPRIVLMVSSIACTVRHSQLSANRMCNENHHSEMAETRGLKL